MLKFTCCNQIRQFSEPQQAQVLRGIQRGFERECLRVDGTGRLATTAHGRDVHIKAIFDDKRRMMAIICHNTDNGDGWEREGYSRFYFHEFSEKKAYPLGINIIFYAMTH